MEQHISAAKLRLHNSPEYNIRLSLFAHTSLVGITAPLNPHTDWKIPPPIVVHFLILIDMHLKLIQQSLVTNTCTNKLISS